MDTYHNCQSYRQFDFHGYATTLSYERYMNSIQIPILIGFTSLIKYWLKSTADEDSTNCVFY